jgi:hypothetical protein
MKRLPLAAMLRPALLLPALLLFLVAAQADTQIPDKLVGVWTTDGSVLKGEYLVSGQALYIDIDGTGAMLSKGPNGGTQSRIAISSYDASTQHIEVEITADSGPGRITLNYEPAEAAITTPEAMSSIYHRRMAVVSPDVRKSLGLKELVNEVPPPAR